MNQPSGPSGQARKFHKLDVVDSHAAVAMKIFQAATKSSPRRRSQGPASWSPAGTVPSRPGTTSSRRGGRDNAGFSGSSKANRAWDRVRQSTQQVSAGAGFGAGGYASHPSTSPKMSSSVIAKFVHLEDVVVSKMKQVNLEGVLGVVSESPGAGGGGEEGDIIEWTPPDSIIPTTFYVFKSGTAEDQAYGARPAPPQASPTRPKTGAPMRSVTSLMHHWQSVAGVSEGVSAASYSPDRQDTGAGGGGHVDAGSGQIREPGERVFPSVLCPVAEEQVPYLSRCLANMLKNVRRRSAEVPASTAVASDGDLGEILIEKFMAVIGHDIATATAEFGVWECGMVETVRYALTVSPKLSLMMDTIRRRVSMLYSLLPAKLNDMLAETDKLCHILRGLQAEIVVLLSNEVCYQDQIAELTINHRHQFCRLFILSLRHDRLIRDLLMDFNKEKEEMLAAFSRERASMQSDIDDARRERDEALLELALLKKQGMKSKVANQFQKGALLGRAKAAQDALEDEARVLAMGKGSKRILLQLMQAGGESLCLEVVEEWLSKTMTSKSTVKCLTYFIASTQYSDNETALTAVQGWLAGTDDVGARGILSMLVADAVETVSLSPVLFLVEEYECLSHEQMWAFQHACLIDDLPPTKVEAGKAEPHPYRTPLELQHRTMTEMLVTISDHIHDKEKGPHELVQSMSTLLQEASFDELCRVRADALIASERFDYQDNHLYTSLMCVRMDASRGALSAFKQKRLLLISDTVEDYAELRDAAAPCCNVITYDYHSVDLQSLLLKVEDAYHAQGCVPFLSIGFIGIHPKVMRVEPGKDARIAMVANVDLTLASLKPPPPQLPKEGEGVKQKEGQEEEEPSHMCRFWKAIAKCVSSKGGSIDLMTGCVGAVDGGEGEALLLELHRATGRKIHASANLTRNMACNQCDLTLNYIVHTPTQITTSDATRVNTGTIYFDPVMINQWLGLEPDEEGEARRHAAELARQEELENLRRENAAQKEEIERLQALLEEYGMRLNEAEAKPSEGMNGDDLLGRGATETPPKWIKFLRGFKPDNKNKTKLLTVEEVIKKIATIYEKKVIADQADDEKKGWGARDTLEEFVAEQYLFEYGMKTIAQPRLYQFSQSLKKHYAENKRVALFADMAVLSGDTGSAGTLCDFFLLCISQLYQPANTISKRMDNPNEPIWVLESDFKKCMTAIHRKQRSEWPGLYCSQATLDAMREEGAAMATTNPTMPGKCVPLSDILSFLVNKWIMVEVEFDDLLCKLFDDNDDDGNGCIDLSELKRMTHGLGHELEEKPLRDLFKKLNSESDGDSVSRGTWCSVARKERLWPKKEQVIDKIKRASKRIEMTNKLFNAAKGVGADAEEAAQQAAAAFGGL